MLVEDQQLREHAWNICQISLGKIVALRRPIPASPTRVRALYGGYLDVTRARMICLDIVVRPAHFTAPSLQKCRRQCVPAVAPRRPGV